MIAVMAIGAWALSAVLSAWMPGMREGVPRALLGVGWLLALGALATALAGWQRISSWAADAARPEVWPATRCMPPPRSPRRGC